VKTAMKNYIKPTIEILENQIDNSTKYNDNSETDYIYELALIHTLRQNLNRAFDDSKLTGS